MAAKRETRFEIYEQLEWQVGNHYQDRWRWRLRHKNGNILADGGEPYNTLANAKRAVNNIRRYMHAPIEVLKGE